MAAKILGKTRLTRHGEFWNLNSAPNRATRRVMMKENKKMIDRLNKVRVRGGRKPLKMSAAGGG